MEQLLKNAYLNLQILADSNVNWAVQTDSLRASLRSEIADITGKSEQETQDQCEELSYKMRCFNK